LDLHNPPAEYGAGSILNLLTAAAAALERTADNALAPLGLNQRSLALLEQLVAGPLSAAELTLLAGLPGEDIKALLSGLESRGYIERPGSAGRSSGFVLTNKGRRAAAAAQLAVGRAAHAAGAALPKLRPQLAALIQALGDTGGGEESHAADEE
jgi:DNA-binding MarR family transcriptional regulator